VHGLQASGLAGLGDQVVHRLARELCPAFRNEQPRQAIGAHGEVALDGPELVPLDRVLDAERAFQPADPQARMREVRVLATEADDFAHPEAVSIRHEHQQVVATPVPALPRRLEDSTLRKSFERSCASTGLSVSPSLRLLLTFRLCL
jgi:hypothetical protein